EHAQPGTDLADALPPTVRPGVDARPHHSLHQSAHPESLARPAAQATMVPVEAPLRLATDRITVEVDPAAGGRLAQLRVDGSPLLVGYGDVPAELCTADGSPAAMAWGAYPMVPWAGRIR